MAGIKLLLFWLFDTCLFKLNKELKCKPKL